MVTLSPATVKAQQDLSNKFGIPTFTTTGKISTVPITRAINPKINVGLGGFKSKRSFNKAVQKRITLNTKKSTTKKPKSVFVNNPTSGNSKTGKNIGGLSPKTLQAQQELSDKFGIPTFTRTGDLSTIPENLEFSGIFVGLGGFENEDSLIDAIVEKADLTPNEGIFSSAGNSIENFITFLFGDPSQETAFVPDLGFPTNASEDDNPNLRPDVIISGLGGVSGEVTSNEDPEDKGLVQKLLDNPIALAVAGIGILLLASRGKRR